MIPSQVTEQKKETKCETKEWKEPSRIRSEEKGSQMGKHEPERRRRTTSGFGKMQRKKTTQIQ